MAIPAFAQDVLSTPRVERNLTLINNLELAYRPPPTTYDSRHEFIAVELEELLRVCSLKDTQRVQLQIDAQGVVKSALEDSTNRKERIISEPNTKAIIINDRRFYRRRRKKIRQIDGPSRATAAEHVI